MLPAGFIVASGFTIMLLVIWIRSLKREWQQLEEESERHAAQETEPKLQPILVLMPDKQVKYGLRMGKVDDVKALVAQQNKKKKGKKGKGSDGPKIVEIDITEWLSNADLSLSAFNDEQLLLAAAEMFCGADKPQQKSEAALPVVPPAEMAPECPTSMQPCSGCPPDAPQMQQDGTVEEEEDAEDNDVDESSALLNAANSTELSALTAVDGTCTANAEVQLGDSLVGVSCSITISEGKCAINFGRSAPRTPCSAVDEVSDTTPLMERMPLAAS